MNKKIVTLFMVCFLILILSACGTSSKTGLQNSVKPGDGWVDCNTYRITASGKSSDSEAIYQRIETAEREAVNKARMNLIKRFNLHKNICEDLNVSPTRAALNIELREIINSGRVIDRYYHSSTNECEVFYEIRSEGLRRKVEAVQ